MSEYQNNKPPNFKLVSALNFTLRQAHPSTSAPFDKLRVTNAGNELHPPNSVGDIAMKRPNPIPIAIGTKPEIPALGKLLATISD